MQINSKTCVKRPILKDRKLVFKSNYCLMQVTSIAECSFIKLPFVIKIFVLAIFERPFYTGFTVVTKDLSCKVHKNDFHIQSD